ncbi:site-2 protease family protein [Actinomycetospora termitidis]|uniref:Site-2 protease family protein n=1 Tax=Actinomycetospora termitidis TaxID=3053470 RepID=A0ABT7M9S4_9PSEU|nr:site-2 protease family protein [Actinomycetospora sp. Odt1-22]MDL5157196.1 site-2 protease family protein [Actinomycetospora sp. Odt1-22]
MASLRSGRSLTRTSPIFLGLVAATVAGCVLTLFDSEIAITAGVVVIVLAGWAVSLCLHEFAHALTAHRCGDPWVRARGYLTLDITKYANVGLTFVLPLLFLLIGGIPLPGGAVYISRGSLRARWASSLVSAAGPLVNLVLAVLLALLVPFVPVYLAAGLSFLALIQVLAFVLNILPIPGLDGWGVIDPYLSERTRQRVAPFTPYAPLLLFVVLIFFRPAAEALFDLATFVYSSTGGDSSLAEAGRAIFFFWQR